MDIIIIVAVFVIIICCMDYIFKPKFNIPIAQPRIPVLGHLFSLCNMPHEKFRLWAKQYGSIFSCHIFNEQLVVLNDYEEIYCGLVTKGKQFAGRKHVYRLDLLFNRKDIIMMDYCKDWKKFKQFSLTAVKRHGEQKEYSEIIINQITDELSQSILRDSNEGIIDPFENIYLTVTNSVLALLTGKKYKFDDPMFLKWMEIERRSVENASALGKGIELDAFPWLRHFGNHTYKMLISLNQTLDNFYQALKEEYVNLADKTEAFGIFFDLLKDSEKRESPIDKEMVKNFIGDMIIAGTGTSVSSLYFAVLLLAAFPDIQKRLHTEVISCLVNKPDKLMKVSLKDRNLMPVTRAFLFESQRYGSLVPIAVPHTTLENTSIGKCILPKGTQVIFNLWNLHHNDKYWNNPWSFNPDRFLDENGGLVPCDHINRTHLMAFSAGPRVCLGQAFALDTLFTFVTSLVADFEIKPIPGIEIEHDPRSFGFEAILSPKRCCLKFIKRN